MDSYKIELSTEDQKVFSILESVPNPYKVYRKLERIERIRTTMQDESTQMQQHNWQTPLGFVLKKGDQDAFME